MTTVGIAKDIQQSSKKATERDDDKFPTIANVKQYYYQLNTLYQQMSSKYLRNTDVVITIEATRK